MVKPIKLYFRIGFTYGKSKNYNGEGIFEGVNIKDAILALKRYQPNATKICYFTEVKKEDFDKEQQIRDLNDFLKKL